jgi:hypothetical protein
VRGAHTTRRGGRPVPLGERPRPGVGLVAVGRGTLSAAADMRRAK